MSLPHPGVQTHSGVSFRRHAMRTLAGSDLTGFKLFKEIILDYQVQAGAGDDACARMHAVAMAAPPPFGPRREPSSLYMHMPALQLPSQTSSRC